MALPITDDNAHSSSLAWCKRDSRNESILYGANDHHKSEDSLVNQASSSFLISEAPIVKMKNFDDSFTQELKEQTL